MKRWLLFWTLVAAAAVGCAPAMKDVKPSLASTDSGAIWFASAGTLVRSADGSRLTPGDPVVLSGELSFPSGTGPFPAMVLAHGCNGIGVVETQWARMLREWGYATLVVDSFRGRGLIEVCTNGGTLTSVQRIPDAYGALRILATHPRVDARRIVLMGFSHAGALSMGASTVWAKTTFAPRKQPAFRAFFAFYPYCNTVFPEREHVSAPVRIHIGELDDWTPARSCIQLAESLRASGQDVTITVYAGAYHTFLYAGLGFVRQPNVDNAAGCTVRLASILGPLATPSEIAACLQKGATIAGNPKAAEQARQNVRTQLTELLK
jgi:dienelactone hydrolase